MDMVPLCREGFHFSWGASSQHYSIPAKGDDTASFVVGKAMGEI